MHVHMLTLPSSFHTHTHNSIQAFVKDAREQARRHGHIFTLLGRPRSLPNIRSNVHVARAQVRVNDGTVGIQSPTRSFPPPHACWSCIPSTHHDMKQHVRH